MNNLKFNNSGLEMAYGQTTAATFGVSNESGRIWYVGRKSQGGLGASWTLVYATEFGLILYSEARDEWDGCKWSDVHHVATGKRTKEDGFYIVYEAEGI